MSKKQLPALPEATTAEDNDLLLKRDDSSGSDQKLSIQTLRDEAFGDAAVEDASVTPTPDTLAKRDGVGRIQAASGGSGNETVVHDDTSTAANANTIAKRDGSGRIAVGQATDFNHAAQLGQTKNVGEIFYLWDHLSGVNAPDNSGDRKFIRLTAGPDGSGEYNQGLLENETVSGSSPLVEATADIATGPLQGQTVHLINTEESVLRAREASGELQFDRMQRITGVVQGQSQAGAHQFFRAADGVFSISGIGPTVASSVDSAAERRQILEFDSANSPNARVSTTTSGETRAKNVSATAYMRIQ